MSTPRAGLCSQDGRSARWRATPTQRSTPKPSFSICVCQCRQRMCFVCCVCVYVCVIRRPHDIARHTYSMGIPGFNVHSNLDFAFAAVAL